MMKYSCLTCRERKVKCDRVDPCSNCRKAARHCSFAPPVRGKRRRKAPKEGLHAKLRRYEELLKSYGAKIEPSEHDGDSDAETLSQSDMAATPDARSDVRSTTGSSTLELLKPKLIDEDGSSRFFDSSLWSNLGSQFPYPVEEGLDEATERRKTHETDLFLASPEQDGLAVDTFASLHPPYHILLKLWDIFIDRVDPLMKILHLPTFWTSLMNALQRPQDVPKSQEALFCAFYLPIISSLEENECLVLLGGPKSAIFPRYERAARRALRAAGFLHTSSLMTLRAYLMFLMGVRSSTRSDTMYTMSGVAVRLAQRMGLHREGSSLGLSPFETEMRRRLWAHICHVDFKIADLIGAQPSMDLLSGDAKTPLNVPDEDLSPDMAELPPERKSISPIVVCLMRCEMIAFLRNFRSPASHHSGHIFMDSDFSLTKKDSLIKELESRLEDKFLRYCDPSNTLHILVSVMVRSGICKIKLFAHNPKRYANAGLKVPQAERDVILTNAIKMLEYVNLVRSNQDLEKYMWQIGTSLLWTSFLYVLIEARHRRVGPEVDRMWQLMEVTLSKYPKMFERNTSAVYSALGKWTLEAWDEYVAANIAEGLPEPCTPEYIDAIRRCRAPVIEPPSIPKPPIDLGPVTGTPAKQDRNTFSEFDLPTSYDSFNLPSFEMDIDEWTQWENLVAVEGVGPANIM